MVPMYASAYSTTNRPLTGCCAAVLDCPMNPEYLRSYVRRFTPLRVHMLRHRVL